MEAIAMAARRKAAKAPDNAAPAKDSTLLAAIPKPPRKTPSPRKAGILGELACPLGLGLLRLSTEERPSEADAIAVVHFALEHGVRVLDTADVYCLGADDLHYGEQLVRTALDSWRVPKHEVKILTKVGMSRPKGRWIPSGRPKHIRQAVEGSLKALRVERLFLLQLHVHDPMVPFEDTLTELAKLQREGKVEHLGLCNTSIAEIRQAERHFVVATVQNELSVLDRKSAKSGLLAETQARGIPFLAHRPLGGHAKVGRIAKDKVLLPLAERHGATPHEIALAALLEAGPNVIPLVGATRIDSIRSSLAAVSLALDVSDRTVLDIKYSFAAEADSLGEPSISTGLPASSLQAPAMLSAAPLAPIRLSQSTRRPGTAPEVVIVMGIQGAGKSTLMTGYVEHGYARLNRDIQGGKLDDLVPMLARLLAQGQTRVVLDNTYPTRLSRAPVIATARARGVPIHCRFLQTPPGEARINLALRMFGKYGRLLGPEDMKALSKTDPSLPPPVALTRWLASFEPPSLDEGFASVEVIEFERRTDPKRSKMALLLDVDGTLRRTRSGEIYPRSPDDVELLPGRREILAQWIETGYLLFFVSNQSGIASGKLDCAAADAAFARTVELLDLPVAEIAYCPHPAFPVGCFCRKPMPGLGVLLMERHGLARSEIIVVGDMDSDAQFAAELGARYVDAEHFFGSDGPKP